MGKTLRNMRRGEQKTRKAKGGFFGFMNSIFGSVEKQAQGLAKMPTEKAKFYTKNSTDPNAPLAPGAGFSRYSFSLGPGLNYTSTTNAYGHKVQGLSGTVPMAFGLAAAAQRVTNPPENGILGLKGNISEFSKYPNPYRDLGVSTKASNAEIKSAYNSKKVSANNSQKKILNAAFNTLSNPERRAKYDSEAFAFFKAHPPEPGNIVAAMRTGTNAQKRSVNMYKQLGL